MIVFLCLFSRPMPPASSNTFLIKSLRCAVNLFLNLCNEKFRSICVTKLGTYYGTLTIDVEYLETLRNYIFDLLAAPIAYTDCPNLFHDGLVQEKCICQSHLSPSSEQPTYLLKFPFNFKLNFYFVLRFRDIRLLFK